MGEVGDLLELFGAIDRAVAERPPLAEDVARFLPVYRDLQEDGLPFRWYDDFVATMTASIESGGVAQQLEPIEPSDRSLDQVLASLAETPPRGRLGVRRLLGIAVVTQIGDRLSPPPDPLELSRALGPGPAFEGVVATVADFSSLDAWPTLLTAAYTSSPLYTTEHLAMHAADPPSCSGTTIGVAKGPHGSTVASFRTAFSVPRNSLIPGTTLTLTPTRATRFLDPKHWTKHPFWKTMALVRKSATTTTYRETVSFSDSLSFQAQLDFRRTGVPAKNGQPPREHLRYALDHQPGASERVQVDEGDLYLDLREHDFEVRTTKRLAFERSTPTPALAFGLCVAGYGDNVYDLFFRCAGATS